MYICDCKTTEDKVHLMTDKNQNKNKTVYRVHIFLDNAVYEMT